MEPEIETEECRKLLGRSCAALCFLLKYIMGYCHNGRRPVLLCRGTIPLTTGKAGKGGIAHE